AVHVENGGHVDAPVALFEPGVAVVEVEGEAEELGVKQLVGTAEELLLERIGGRLEGAGADRGLAAVKEQQALGDDLQEGVLAGNGIVALEDVLLERVA